MFLEVRPGSHPGHHEYMGASHGARTQDDLLPGLHLPDVPVLLELHAPGSLIVVDQDLRHGTDRARHSSGRGGTGGSLSGRNLHEKRRFYSGRAPVGAPAMVIF